MKLTRPLTPYYNAIYEYNFRLNWGLDDLIVPTLNLRLMRNEKIILKNA